MGFTGLATAVSGLKAAQRGLAVTGHNMANSQIEGYSRQRSIQKDFRYQNIGVTSYGPLQKGLGTDWNAVEQIRNGFLDITYRKYNGKLNFYTVKANTGSEIESLLGEMQGAYNFQTEINGIWDALEELSQHVDGIETRDKFLATCSSFITKANDVYNGLFEYQHRLDEQIRDSVKDINGLVERVHELNQMITASEASGDNANDYRDERNLCLDKLSGYVSIDVSEDKFGAVNIIAEGQQLLVQGAVSKLGLRQCAGGYSFVEPVFTGSNTVLSASTPPEDFKALFSYDRPYNAERDNDYGTLKGLILARGAMPAYYPGKDALWEPKEATFDPFNDPVPPLTPQEQAVEIAHMKQTYNQAGNPPYTLPAADARRAYEAAQYNYRMQCWSMDNATVPKAMIQLDKIVHSIVTMVNDAVAPRTAPDTAGNEYKDPNAPYDLNGDQSYVEIFRRKNMGRWNPPYTPGDPDTYQTPDYNPANPGLYPNAQYNAEVMGDYYSQYSIGNIVLNPVLHNTEGGYNYMSFSVSGDREDNRLIIDDLLNTWTDAASEYAIDIGGVKYGMQDAYRKFVVGMGIETEEAINFVNNQTLQVTQADNKRNSIMGVSMDEELSSMMKYQYAYQAAARILNVIDSMIDRVVNGTGRAGR